MLNKKIRRDTDGDSFRKCDCSTGQPVLYFACQDTACAACANFTVATANELSSASCIPLFGYQGIYAKYYCEDTFPTPDVKSYYQITYHSDTTCSSAAVLTQAIALNSCIDDIPYSFKYSCSDPKNPTRKEYNITAGCSSNVLSDGVPPVSTTCGTRGAYSGIFICYYFCYF